MKKYMKKDFLSLNKLKLIVVDIIIFLSILLWIFLIFKGINKKEERVKLFNTKDSIIHFNIIDTSKKDLFWKWSSPHTLLDSAIKFSDSIRDTDYRWMYNDDYWKWISIMDSIVQKNHE